MFDQKKKKMEMESNLVFGDVKQAEAKGVGLTIPNGKEGFSIFDQSEQKNKSESQVLTWQGTPIPFPLLADRKQWRRKRYA